MCSIKLYEHGFYVNNKTLFTDIHFLHVTKYCSFNFFQPFKNLKTILSRGCTKTGDGLDLVNEPPYADAWRSVSSAFASFSFPLFPPLLSHPLFFLLTFFHLTAHSPAFFLLPYFTYIFPFFKPRCHVLLVLCKHCCHRWKGFLKHWFSPGRGRERYMGLK